MGFKHIAGVIALLTLAAPGMAAAAEPALSTICRDLAPYGPAASASVLQQGEDWRQAGEAAYGKFVAGKSYSAGDLDRLRTAFLTIYRAVGTVPPFFRQPDFVNGFVARTCAKFSNGAVTPVQAVNQLTALGYPVDDITRTSAGLPESPAVQLDPSLRPRGAR